MEKPTNHPTTGTPAATVPQQETRSGLEIAREHFAGSSFRLPGSQTTKAAVPTDAEVMASLSNEALTMRALLMLGGMSAADANARAIEADRGKMTGKELARTQWAGTDETEKAVNAANQARWDEALQARNEKAQAIEKARQENNFHGLNLAPVHYTPIKAPATPAAITPTDAEVMATLSDEALTLRAQLIMGGMSNEDANARAIASDRRKPMTEGQAIAMVSRMRRAEDAQAALRKQQQQQPAAPRQAAPESTKTPAADSVLSEQSRAVLSKLRKEQNSQSTTKAASPPASTTVTPPVTPPKLTDEEKLAGVAVAMVEEPGAWLGSATTPSAIRTAASAYLAKEAPALSKDDRNTVAGFLAEEQGAQLRKNMEAFQRSTAAAPQKPATGTPAAPKASSAALPASTAKPASTGLMGWLERKMKLNRFTTGSR